MKTMTLKHTLAACACLMIVTPAMALTPLTSGGACSQDADCGPGMVCEEQDAPSVGCVQVPCEEGDVECEMQSADCETDEGEVVSACAPKPPEACDPDAASPCSDAALKCMTFTHEACSGPPAVVPPPLQEGDESSPDRDVVPEDEREECVTEVESYCVPPYFDTCQVDADCGVGFTCEEEESCDTCSAASVCSVGPDGVEVCKDADPTGCEESCEPTGQRYCELVDASCEQDSDCAQGLTCQESEHIVVPPCVVGEEEGQSCEEPVIPESQGACLPPDWQRWSGEYADAFDGHVSGGGAPTQESPVPSAPEFGECNEEVGQEEDDDGCGCSNTGSQGSPAGMGLLAALGLMIGRRRRKRRVA